MTIREWTEEDFANAVKNPYFDRLNKRVEVIVKRTDYEYFSEVAHMNDEKPEDVMRRILRLSAKRMREHDE